MEITVDLTQDIGYLERIILKEIRIALNAAMNRSVKNIKQRLGELLKSLIMQTPEFDSLVGGKLKAEFGLADPGYALEQILNKLSESINIIIYSAKIVGSEIQGGMRIELLSVDYSNILGLSVSKYRSGRYTIPWLEWLIIKGDSLIITDYSIRYLGKPIGRTGTAIMGKSKKGWRVPAEFTGVPENNFLTRAFTDYPDTERLIGEVIEEEITSRLI